eukprot:5718106-Pyramimonas_sp.AAC.3
MSKCLTVRTCPTIARVTATAGGCAEYRCLTWCRPNCHTNRSYRTVASVSASRPEGSPAGGAAGDCVVSGAAHCAAAAAAAAAHDHAKVVLAPGEYSLVLRYYDSAAHARLPQVKVRTGAAEQRPGEGVMGVRTETAAEQRSGEGGQQLLFPRWTP